MARAKQDLRDSLDAAGLLEKIGVDRIFMRCPPPLKLSVTARTVSPRRGGLFRDGVRLPDIC
jgi:hypothetical protein